MVELFGVLVFGTKCRQRDHRIFHMHVEVTI